MKARTVAGRMYRGVGIAWRSPCAVQDVIVPCAGLHAKRKAVSPVAPRAPPSSSRRGRLPATAVAVVRAVRGKRLLGAGVVDAEGPTGIAGLGTLRRCRRNVPLACGSRRGRSQ